MSLLLMAVNDGDEPVLPVLLGFVAFGFLVWLLSLIPWDLLIPWMRWIGQRPQLGDYADYPRGVACTDDSNREEFCAALEGWRVRRPRRKIEGKWSRF